MPIYALNESIVFPSAELASEEGIIAIGGNLSPERLLLAYSKGIFPWYSEEEPILWWSPDPRFILFPTELIIPKSLKKFLKKNSYQVSFDKNFKEVINKCRELRITKKQGTWITNEMVEAYIALHEIGYAHSVETWHNDTIVGGLYGVSIGKCFFGESMFSESSNASKFALIKLTEKAIEMNFNFIDCQVYTSHLEAMGAKNIKREEYLKLLEIAINDETLIGNWKGI